MKNINSNKIKKKKSLKELLEFGIINLDKPSGPTSFQVAEKVGRMLGARKFSHFGTLDPKVTGVLPIALNRACKLARWFMKKEKKYVGIMRLHKDISEEKLKNEMDKFVGKIKQLPPVRSRVKRQERERQVYIWKLLEFDKKRKEALFEVEVEAGTYIRKLISDLGFKTGGAHMTELRRTGAGIFNEDDKKFVNLYELERAVEKYKAGREEELREIIIPAEIIVEILPVAEVEEKSVSGLLIGKPIFKEDLKGRIKAEKGESIAVFCREKFIEVARFVNESKIVLKPEFVFN
jgi:H/ACA ribonucleoprotein complex subunit 4